jgi:hypothetical protein
MKQWLAKPHITLQGKEYIMATFRSALATLALLFALAPPAQADILTITGNTSGAPVWHRITEDLLDLSPNGTAVTYHVTPLRVSVDGFYTFLTTADFDSFIFMYAYSFDPADPFTNALGANDDLFTTTTSGFVGPMSTGVDYFLVTTGYSNVDYGNYSTTIGGPGHIALIPEPSTWMMSTLGLALIGFARRRQSSSK